MSGLAQVFFIRDGFKFPDLVHALRPNPRNNIQEAWRFLDFLSYHPESAHIVRHSCSRLNLMTPSSMMYMLQVPSQRRVGYLRVVHSVQQSLHVWDGTAQKHWYPSTDIGSPAVTPDPAPPL